MEPRVIFRIPLVEEAPAGDNSPAREADRVKLRGARRGYSAVSRFLTPSLAVLVIPVLVAYVIERQAGAAVEQNTLDDNQLVLDQGREIIDRYLEELVLTVQRLTLNKAISTFLSMDRLGQGDPRVCNLNDAFDAISSYRVTNPFIRELFLYARNSDTLLSTRTVHININLDYRAFFRFGDIEPGMWRSELLSRTYRTMGFRRETVTLYGLKRPCIAAFQSIPLNSGENSLGTLIALIDQDTIRGLLSKITTAGGTVYITDADGEMLFGASGAATTPPSPPSAGISGANEPTMGAWVVSRAISSLSGWRYVSLLPHGIVMAKVYRIRVVTWAITAALVLAGLAVAILLAYRNSRPVREIAALARSLLGDADRRAEDLAYIRESMVKLISSNRQLEEARRRELPFARAAFLERLLKGAIHGEEDLAALVKYNGIDLPGDRFVVFAVAIEGFGDMLRQDILRELDLNRILIRDAFTRQMPCPVHVVDLALDRIALVCSFDSTRATLIELEQAVQEVRAGLRDTYNAVVVVAEGRTCESLRTLNESFEEAWKALHGRQRSESEPGLVRRGVSSTQRNGFFYPLELESRLIHLTRAGHVQEVERIIDEVFDANFVRRRLSPVSHRLLHASLVATLMRLAMEEEGFTVVDADRLQETAGSPEARFALVRRVFADMSSTIAARRRKSKERLIDRILLFVRDSYRRPELNLSVVASAFGLKESYLYHFFKEAVGTTFTAHLESLRIEQACTLLRTTERSVDEITMLVGYGSAHSFRRAFKRCTGLSPSEFQRTQRGVQRTEQLSHE